MKFSVLTWAKRDDQYLHQNNTQVNIFWFGFDDIKRGGLFDI